LITLTHQGIRPARRVRPAIGELHVLPLQAGVFQRCTHRKLALAQSARALGTAEGMNADADDANFSHHDS
jgi:hypothetical protein